MFSAFIALQFGDLTNWYTLVVPSKTPSELVAALNGIMNKALAASDVRAAYAQQGMETPGAPRPTLPATSLARP
jgi:tripartite-type tricarboxylate transporter receptor subunit TctC